MMEINSEEMRPFVFKLWPKHDEIFENQVCIHPRIIEA